MLLPQYAFLRPIDGRRKSRVDRRKSGFEVIKFIKNNLPVILLVVILLVGFYLRAYHLDYSPIGYHSMKEVHYLSVAKGYLDYGDFLHKRVLYSGMSPGEGYIEAFPQFQFLPLIYFLLWKMFGVKLWLARLVVIFFSLGAIVLTYRISEKLAGKREVSLLAAFFMAILPLSVFFGRNAQPDTPALFFSLSTTYFFLLWLEGHRSRFFVFFSLAIFFTAIIKITFLFIFIPLLWVFPYGKLADRKTGRTILRQTAWLALAVLLIFAWLAFTKLTLIYSSDIIPFNRLLKSDSFTFAYWKIRLPLVWKYIGMNYTYLGFGIFCAGLLGAILNFGSRLSRYIIGSVFSAILYFILIPDFAVRHSYYHLPFLPAVCLGMAAALHEGSSLMELKRFKAAKYLFTGILLLLILPFAKTALNQHFDILIMGSDVAGRYIRVHGESSDRVFLSYGSPSNRGYAGFRTQLYGTLWEADKRGELLPVELHQLRVCERDRNLRWILLYKTEWLNNDRPLLEYIKRHYSIEQIGYKENKILYYLLHRGGRFDPEELGGLESKLARSYEFSYGKIDLWVKEKAPLKVP